MSEGPIFKKVLKLDPEQLHKKIGQMIYVEPGDSDINEGNFMAELWFCDGMTIYLIDEWDTRKERP